jgi:hypothetical protein
MSFPEPPVSLAEVAAVLNRMEHPLNCRDTPRPGDPAGDFDVYFDGGAWKGHTGTRHYTFHDGITAVIVLPAARLQAAIHFPDGVCVAVTQS